MSPERGLVTAEAVKWIGRQACQADKGAREAVEFVGLFVKKKRCRVDTGTAVRFVVINARIGPGRRGNGELCVKAR